MVRVSFLYFKEKNSRFDVNFYINNHMELVKKHLTPCGLLKIEVDVSLLEDENPLHAIGYLYFSTKDEFIDGFSREGKRLKKNIPNYTNIDPKIQISEIYESR